MDATQSRSHEHVWLVRRIEQEKGASAPLNRIDRGGPCGEGAIHDQDRGPEGLERLPELGHPPELRDGSVSRVPQQQGHQCSYREPPVGDNAQAFVVLALRIGDDGSRHPRSVHPRISLIARGASMMTDVPFPAELLTLKSPPSRAS